MSSEVLSAFILCRGKVSSSKQKLLSKFSTYHAPFQYGVDYSPSVKADKVDGRNCTAKNVTETSEHLPSDNVRKAVPSMSTMGQRKPVTFEVMSSINFQTSPPVKRKVILISADDKSVQAPTMIDRKHKETFPAIEKPKILHLTEHPNPIKMSNQIMSPSKSYNKDIRFPESATKQPFSTISEPVKPDFTNQKILPKDTKQNMDYPKTKLDNKSAMKSDFVDPTLVSVAQRAKSISVNRQSRSRSIKEIAVNVKNENEENNEPVLSIKDRIKMFKENLNQTNVTPKTENVLKPNHNRFKTQPLSFDDIARANAMILDQAEGASTIESPSITNSNETLVDLSEGSSSPSIYSPTSLKPIARVQSCFLNSKFDYRKLIDDEDLLPTISVKDLVKSCDKESEVIMSPKLSRNAAVSRRLAFKNKPLTEDKGNSSKKVYARGSHNTQPITKIDIERSTMSRSDSNRSINDRISSIQQNENQWKKRVPSDELKNTRPGSLYEIQEQLQTNQANWKSRVEQKDVGQFTTEAKLQSNDSPGNLCVVRLSKTDKVDCYPTKLTLTSHYVPSSDDNTNESTSDVCTPDHKTPLFDQRNPQQIHSHKVAVPKMSDQNLSNFFNSSESSPKSKTMSGNEHTTDDFDDIFLQTDLTLNIQKRTIKPSRKTRATSKNPVKNLNDRADLVTEYDEITYGVAESELKRCQVENIQQKAGYAEEALAALSSKEDFSKVKLKRTESGKMFEHFVSPYKDLMLISVKGRKKVQVRLVEPVASSINCGDCYLLVTSDRVFVWQGNCANVIEVNKVNELGSWIAKCKDLSYKGNVDKPIVIKSNDSATNANVTKFWSCLKCDKVQYCNNPGSVDEDEIYEQRMQTTNMVYRVVRDQLIPWDDYWGRPLRHQMLSDNQIYIFDFGCELYLWSGNKADNVTRMHGKTLLRQLWNTGFDYEHCSINPLDPLPDSPDKAKARKATTRPDWVIVGRLPQRGETILFKEKFSDWPESSRLIKVDNSISSSLENKSSVSDLTPVDLDEILRMKHPSVHLSIDGKSVGRGGKWKVIEDGILREFDVSTKKVEAWHITENDAVKVEEQSMGQFCNADAYIIRWDFELKTLGRFKGNQSTGNLSSVFFFWQGSRTTVTEKTASALHTIDLDKDKVTQIRVKEHEESPAFCRLFNGSMIVHQGKRKFVPEKTSLTRLFVIRGEIQEESHFCEVNCLAESLRTRSCFLLLHIATGKGYLWFGRLSSDLSKGCARYCIQSLNRKKPTELGLKSSVDIKVQEIEQGNEDRTFWQEIGAIKRWRSCNLSDTLDPIRGWLVSSVTNSFELTELKYSLNPDPDTTAIAPFPLMQISLYKASQPALFIIWSRTHVYLWQGWWPNLTKSTSSDSDDDEIDHDWAIPKNRIAADKLASLKSLNAYLEKHESTGVTASIIYAGLEPLPFQELFPSWEVNETAKMANVKKGYQMYQEDDIPQTLNKYLSEKFSVQRLRTRPLPECVVLSKIEWYLSDEEFESLFKMSKEEFYEMTTWKQREKKKEVNLF